MGTMRLVLDACGCGIPVETGIERLAELLPNPDNRLWLDIRDPGPEDVALLQRVFGFHELALEDVTRPHERPRCDAYPGYYFIVVYAAEQIGRRDRAAGAQPVLGRELPGHHPPRARARCSPCWRRRAAAGTTTSGCRSTASRAWRTRCSRAWWTATS